MRRPPFFVQPKTRRLTMRKKLKETTGLLILSAVLALVITLSIVRREARKSASIPLNATAEVRYEKPDQTDLSPTISLDSEISDEWVQEKALAEIEKKGDRLDVELDDRGENDQPITDESTVPEYNGQGNSGYTFAEAFSDARFRLGPGKVFVWNSMEFTTDLAEEQPADSITGDLASVDSIDLLAKNSPQPE